MWWMKLLLCLLPAPVETAHVDLAEVNHFYDEKGELVFDQVFFSDWCDAAQRFQVREWLLVKTTAHIPHKEWPGEYVVEVTNYDRHRRVISRWFKETWTQYDPELVEREFLPREHRKPLFNLPIR